MRYVRIIQFIYVVGHVNHRLDNVQKILTHRFQTNHNMFQLQTSNGDMIKDMVVTPKEFDPRYGQSTQEEYYFNSLAHHEKVSEIVNSIGLKLKRNSTNSSTVLMETRRIFLNKSKWNIKKKEFNKNVRVLTIELVLANEALKSVS